MLAAACVSLPARDDNPFPPLSEIRGEPADRVTMPGAEVVREVSGERFTNITGPEVAFHGFVFGIQKSKEEVLAFYQQELRRLGWVQDFSPVLSSGEFTARAWCRPRLLFRLAIFDPREYDRVGIRDGSRYTTIFDARIQGSRRPGCPYSPPPFPSP